MHYAHNVGSAAFIKICIFEHLYKISYTDIQIHLIYALHQTRNKRSKNDKEKRTKGLSDFMAKLNLWLKLNFTNHSALLEVFHQHLISIF